MSVESLRAITDPDAYAIYAVLLATELWPDRGDRLLFIIQETDQKAECHPSKPIPEIWRPVHADFEKQNTRTWKLRAPLPTTVRYFLVPRADIKVDDERVARQNPGRWQRLPDSVEFAEFSAVGFNAERTKAVVYARTRDAGGLYVLERSGDRWGVSSAWGCRWIA